MPGWSCEPQVVTVSIPANGAVYRYQTSGFVPLEPHDALPSFVAIVKEAYPDLAPVLLALPRDRAYAVAMEEGEAMGWTITRRDPEAFVFEAEDVTAIFRFVDDVVVRIGDDGTGLAVIEVRSKSRDGRGDIGANAARIRAFLARVLDQGSAAAAGSG